MGKRDPLRQDCPSSCHWTSSHALSTVLVKVEDIFKSKPSGYTSSNVANLDPVTPNILHRVRRVYSIPQVAYVPETIGQILADQFWSQFIRDYLPTLQSRHKWTSTTDNMKEETIVLVMDPQLPRAQWPIGKVIKAHPCPDGRVRSADVLIQDRTYTIQYKAICPSCPSSCTATLAALVSCF